MARREREEFYKQERAHILMCFKLLTPRELTTYTAGQIVKLFGLSAQSAWVSHLRIEYIRTLQKEDAMLEQLDPQFVRAERALNELAAIQTKSYEFCGEDESIAESDVIRDSLAVLKEYDPTILDRNARRRPSKKKRAANY